MNFNKDKTIDAFLSDEYARHLEAMKEPSLWHFSSKDKKIEVYRFLCLHPDRHPFCVRVENDGHSVKLRFVVLDGVWVDNPGLIAIDRSIDITMPQWNELVHRTRQAGLWTLDSHDKDTVELIDNNRVLVEGLKDRRYHAVARWTGYLERIPCQTMCEYMFDIAKLFLSAVCLQESYHRRLRGIGRKEGRGEKGDGAH